MDISANIKAIRHSKAIPQAEVSRRLDLDPSSYHRLENRGSKLSFEQAEKIAQALGVSLMELITWDAPQQTSFGLDQGEGIKRRIEELEDRVRDKEKIIQKLESEIEETKDSVSEYIWFKIHELAMDQSIGEVVVEYPNEQLRVPMAVYTGKDKSTTVSDDFYSRKVILTDNEVESLFVELLRERGFGEWTEFIYQIDYLEDEQLSEMFPRICNTPKVRVTTADRRRRSKQVFN